jgi:hypothetical protein
MRDGIWKDLPLSREWRSTLRSALREADHGSTLRGKMSHALAKSLAGVSASFLRRLQRRASDDRPVLPGLGDISSLGAVTPLEALIARRFVQLEAGGGSGPSLVQQACGDGLLQFKAQMGRALRQHISLEGEAGPALKALAAAEATINVNEIAAACLNGQRPPRAEPRRPVNLDEDLTVSI